MLPSGTRSQLLDWGACSPIEQGGGQPYKPGLRQLRGLAPSGKLFPFPPVNNQPSTIWVENAYVGGVLKLNFYGT